MGYGGLINAFSSGLVDGARTGAIMDATFAEQDKRELESQARDVKGFVDYLSASGNDFGKALETPEGQQMAYKAMAANPAVRSALSSAPGFTPTGMVKGPDGRFAFVGQDSDGNIRPLSVGGKAVTYDAQQLMAMTAASAGQLGVDNSAQQYADVEQLAQQQGDVYDTLEKQGMGSAADLRALGQQGQQFIEQGGIPVQKGGVQAVRQSIRAERPAAAAQQTSQVIDPAQGTKSSAKIAVPDLLRPASVRQEEKGGAVPVAGFDELSPSEMAMSNSIQASLNPKPKGVLKSPPKSGNSFKDERQARANEMLARISQSSAKLAGGSSPTEEASTPFMQKLGAGFGFAARKTGESARTLVENANARIDDVKGVVSSVADSAGGLVSDFKEGFTGEKAPAQSAKASVESAPVAKTAAPAQQSTVERAVAKERLSSKMVSTPEKLNQVDSAFTTQISQEPMPVRVQNDGKALERLAKLGQGSKPNSAQLHAVFRLAKSGLLPAASVAMFRETGKLDNTAFDNAYKEHAVRQNYMQIAQADNRLAFDKYKEVNDQARFYQGKRIVLMQEAMKQGRLNDAQAQKAAEVLDKKGTSLLTNSVVAEFRRMPAYKDLSDGAIKSEAETAVQYMLADGQYVAPMLGGRTVPTSMPDYVALSEAIPQLVGRRFGTDGIFSSSVAATPVFNKFKNAGREVIGVQK